MLDVTALVLQDHETLRRQFAALDDARSPEAQRAVWQGLARMLEVHASCEEVVFYPALMQRGENAEDETQDALEDHNSIRDAVRRAARETPGSEAWWEAVNEARAENSDHLAEEEREALSDFRRNAPDELRERLAVQWLDWRFRHDSGQGVSDEDRDVEGYLDATRP